MRYGPPTPRARTTHICGISDRRLNMALDGWLPTPNLRYTHEEA
jgi:hypothetical protein